MNRHIKLAVAIALASAATASAQNTYSGYFLDDYTYRFQMNPAFGNQDNLVGIPVIGNINAAMQGNLHLNNVLHVVNGKTVLFTNPEVPSSVVNKFKNVNRLGTNEKFNIATAGFKALGGYNTVSISANVNANIGVPKAFFQLAKEGIENKTYDIKNLTANANAYAQIALNHSRDISQVPGLRVGAALKFYVGVANLDAYFNRAELQLGENSWNAITTANIYASINGFKYKTKFNETSGREYVSGADVDFKGLNGFGMGFDLGAQYKWRDFDFSLAILDLGFISWGKTQWASTYDAETGSYDRHVQTSDYIFDASDLDSGWDSLKEGIEDLYQLSDMGELSSRTRAMSATVNIGVGYEFPLYRPLKFGFLSSTVINGRYTWSQARFSANVAPVKWVSASANFEASTFGCGFGWLLNFYTRGINVFLGMDHTLGKLAKQGVPLNSNASVNLGINVPL